MEKADNVGYKLRLLHNQIQLNQGGAVVIVIILLCIYIDADVTSTAEQIHKGVDIFGKQWKQLWQQPVFSTGIIKW